MQPRTTLLRVVRILGTVSHSVPSDLTLTILCLFTADIGYGKTKWRQERIWVESVDRENKAVKEWQEKWSFMADYDPKVSSSSLDHSLLPSSLINPNFSREI